MYGKRVEIHNLIVFIGVLFSVFFRKITLFYEVYKKKYKIICYYHFNYRSLQNKQIKKQRNYEHNKLE